jgi:hypothetical protein
VTVAPSRLRIEFERKRDGSVVFRCVRPDGTATWQRREGHTSLFFASHDLTHYAVETVLGVRRAFFGLIAEGWDIDDTGGKSARGPIPLEAGIVEHIVGLLDRDGMGGAALHSADYVNARVAQALGVGKDVVTETQLAAIRVTVASLKTRFATLQPGGPLSLDL